MQRNNSDRSCWLRMAWFLVSFCDFCVRCFNPCIFQCLCGLSPPCWKPFPTYGKNLPLCSLMDYSFQWQLLVLQVLEQLVASLAHPLNKPKHSSCRIRDISCLNLQKSLGFKQRIRVMLQKIQGSLPRFWTLIPSASSQNRDSVSCCNWNFSWVQSM